MSTYFISTLGCRVNQYESQAIAEALQKKGMLPAEKPELAENIYINSCAVTSAAVRDLNKLVRRMHALSPNARIIVTGCAAQVFKQDLDSLPEVDLVIPQKQKKELLFSLEQSSEPVGRKAPDYSITTSTRARPVLKVQDGCSRACSYCIVPRARGGPVSRRPDEILSEIKSLLNKDFAEIVLCGINLGQYGHDLDTDFDFWNLFVFLEKSLLPDWENRVRLRLSSLDPSLLNSRALEVIAWSKLLCPHFHLALQSGSTRILSLMRRDHYHPEEIAVFVRRLQQIKPDFALGADILVGFPGENFEDFSDTRKLVDELPLTYAHVFSYSPRPHTPAAGYSAQVYETDKKLRSKIIKKLVQDKKNAFLQSLLDQKKMRLVMENEHKGMSQYYVHCEALHPLPGFKPGSRAVAAPLRVESSKLWVELLGQYW